MADAKVKDDFNHILSGISRKFEVQQTKWEADSKMFEARIKTQIPGDSEDFNTLCDEWVDRFSEVTATIWAKKTSNTGPKIRFRKQYQCWTGEGKIIKKEMLFDRTRCKGSLDLKVLSDNPLSKRKNKHARQGLNLAVKISFIHLHPVDTTQPFAFFVHQCIPQQDIPKIQIQPNSRLSELVAAMVENGPNVSRKAAEKAEKIMAKLNETKDLDSNVTSNISHDQHSSVTNNIDQPNGQTNQIIINYEGNINGHQSNQIIQQPLCVEVIGSSALDPAGTIKLEPHVTDQQYTQFVVNSSQFDFAEQILMYQPFVLDVPQFISLSGSNITPQFLQIQTKTEDQHQGGQIL